MQTIFSIDPQTGQPFIAPEIAIKVIQFHIAHYGKNLLNLRLNSMDDLTQSAFEFLIRREYDPSRSAPKTFIIMVTTSFLGHRWMYENTKMRSAIVISETQAIPGEEDTFTYEGVENVTPEDILLAKELVTDFVENTPIRRCKRRGTTKIQVPRGYYAQRPLRKPRAV